MITLDKHDVRFIYEAKHATNDTRAFLEKAYDIWRERCALPKNMVDWCIAQAMVMHFLPMVMELRPGAIYDILSDSNPNAARWYGAKVPEYWDMILYHVGMEFATTTGNLLPRYMEIAMELKLYPENWKAI